MAGANSGAVESGYSPPRSLEQYGGTLHFLVLGPLTVIAEGREVGLPAAKHRALLAALLVRANQTVSAEGLIDALWEGRPPASAAKTLQTYYGPQSLHELMERTTWHSGQHVRQYMMLLEKEGISHHRPLLPTDFAKLPMPQNVWDG